MLFEQRINNLEDWGRIFQDKNAFEPLLEYIAREHGIVYDGIGKCAPGSNAVFPVGRRCGGACHMWEYEYIIKIFAPEESGIGGENDFITEKFGIVRANQLNIAAPRLLASGVINDKYVFRYLVLEYIKGESLADIAGRLSGAERFQIGQSLRKMADQMDIPCERFNDHVLFGRLAEERWRVFSSQFQRERKGYLEAHKREAEVYVHGDLNPDNIIINAERKIYIIDFADAMTAPVELEMAAVLCDGFKFDPDFLSGFMGEYDKDILAERLLYGLLIHDYGANIIRDNIGAPEEFHSLAELKDRILAYV